MQTLLLVATLLCSGLSTAERRAKNQKPSILLLLVDDLRDEFDEMYLPNIKNLAKFSISFKNTFAQQALCAPSRHSFLTSRRPDTIHLYDFYSYWREFAGNYTTLPQFFKNNGYLTFSFGKVFHPGKSSNYTDDYPYSWTEPPYHPSTEIYENSKVCKNDETGILAKNLVCPVDINFQPEKTLPDIQIMNSAVNKLKEVTKVQNDYPFFMAIGFHKPHIPLKFPKHYLEYYPLNKIKLPKFAMKPPTMPTIAWNPWIDVRSRDDIANLNLTFPFGTMPNNWTIKIKQSYYAACTYIDYLIGAVLDNVNFNNTIIVLTSDHGWSLGEHGLWAKYSNFDFSLKVPLIIYAPNMRNSKIKPTISNAIVQLLDLFPTLAELSGVVDELPKCENKQKQLCTEGHSLVPLMKNLAFNINMKNNSWPHPAFSQYPRPGIFPTYNPNSDKPKLHNIRYMGYSIRNNRYRYTEWVEFNHTNFKPNWNKIISREFYDHKIDHTENLNLQDRSELKHIQDYLSFLLRKQNNFCS